MDTIVQPRPGRPRNEDCDRAIEAAAVDLLVEEGFGRMTIEGVAARAGVGKATVYRRWATKQDLVVDAFRHRCEATAINPDTGSVRTDLLELLRSMLAKFQRDGDILAAFAAEQWRHPELAEVYRTTFLAERRAIVQAAIRRGVDRGELPADTDVEFVGDLGSAVIWHRLTVTRLPLDDDLPERIVAHLFPG
jgi:AcrR family transcriptional regulator